MGAIAEGIVAYAQPLLDQTDGSVEQMNKAMTISQLCWNLALLSEDARDHIVVENARPTPNLRFDLPHRDDMPLPLVMVGPNGSRKAWAQHCCSLNVQLPPIATSRPTFLTGWVQLHLY